MNEVILQQEELEAEIQDIELEVRRLLGLGNVPKNNWHLATTKLNERAKKMEALETINIILYNIRN